MTFTTLRPRLMRRSDPVLVSLHRRTDHGLTRIIFEISFTERFLADMKWKMGDRLEIAVGEGPDEGRIRIRPSEQGYFLRVSGASPRPRLSARYWGPETTFPTSPPTVAKPDTINRTLTVELPWVPRVARAAQ